MSEKILICAPAWLGDMIMAHTLIRILAEQGHELHVLAPEWNFAVLERMPEVSKRIPLPLTHGEFKLVERYKIGKALGAEKYDRAIISQNSFKSALIPYFANIPRRTGWLRECRGLLLSDGRKLDKKALPLMVQRYAALAHDKNATWDKDNILYPKLNVTQETIAATVAKHNLNLDKKVLALSPGAAYGKTKQWPTTHFAEVAKVKLVEGYQVWLFGSPKDREATDEIMALTNNACVNLAGQLQLFETVDLIAASAGLISNDSGLLHVAAALNVPVIGIYGSTSPDFTPPLGDKSRTVLVEDLECRPCFQRTCKFGHLRCLTDIEPQRVMTELSSLGV